MIAWTHARPGRWVVDAQEDTHIYANLGDQNRGDHPIHAGDLHQESLLEAVGFQPLGNAQVKRFDIFLSCFEPAHCTVSKKRWCSSTRPSSASTKSSCL